MILLEGTIGAGKSTLLELLKTHISDCKVLSEPLETWDAAHNGSSLLELFYTQPQRWAYTLEMITLMSRVRDFVKIRNEYGPQVICERSIFSGRYCFAQNSYQSGFMSEVEWHMYEQWFNELVSSFAIQPRAIIYLKVNPQLAFERIKQRNRSSEAAITLEYLTNIGSLHDDLMKWCSQELGIPILELDGNCEFERDLRVKTDYIEQVRSFISELS